MSPVIETISEARLEANRENAQLSTGPRTPEGKAHVRLNGLRHGLTGKTIVMPYEDAAAYETFVAGILESLAPEGPAELDLAHTIASGHWRMNRALAIEENVFALGAVTQCGAATNPAAPDADPAIHAALTQAQTFLQNAQQIQLLTLYSGRIDRAVRKNKADLKELQAARRAAHEKALHEATLLAQLAEKEGQAYDPAQDGFGFSKDFLDRYIDRNRRLAEARKLFPAPVSAPAHALKRAA